MELQKAKTLNFTYLLSIIKNVNEQMFGYRKEGEKMSITPIEVEIVGRNEDYFENSQVESRREYIMRKRRADLSSIVKKVLEQELDDEERKILIGMIVQHKSARVFSEEFDAPIALIYRIRDRAQKKVMNFLKYVLIYRDELEYRAITPIEFRNVLALADKMSAPCDCIVHRLNKLMATECIEIQKLYDTPGLCKKSVDEIFTKTRLPSIDEIVIFSDFFGTTSDYLLKGEIKCTKH